MASLKKLAGHTLWYGVSSIAAKLLFQLMTPIITYMLNKPASMVDYGNFSILMSSIAFLNVIFTYGMETAYFRFSSGGTDQKNLFQTIFTSILISSVTLGGVLIACRVPLANLADIGRHPEYITWCILIIAIDAVAAIPFARLRQEERPRKYAFTRLAGIVVNIIITLFLIAYYPSHANAQPVSEFGKWYARNDNVGFLLLANLAGSAVTLLLLYEEWLAYRFKFDAELWKKIITYSAPMLIIGLGGMINETFDRIMLGNLGTGGKAAAKIATGIYGANYKIAIFITLFITAFKMSAEPFFFSQSADKNAPKTYAKVMKWFVIILCFAFLFTANYIDLWKYFVGSKYRSGLGVVPILLAANVCLGIYYNLSAWYKITNQMRFGMFITLLGAAITLVLNFAFIPRYGMYACAWTTLAAYGTMMVVSYIMGQKYFPVPYNLKKLFGYLGVMLALFFAQQLVVYFTPIVFVHLLSASVFMLLFLCVVIAAEKAELGNMPFIGKWIKPAATVN